MTLTDYMRYSKGFFEREENEWERTRIIAALIYNSNASKGKQKKVEDLIPLNKDKAYAKQRVKKAQEARRLWEQEKALKANGRHK